MVEALQHVAGRELELRVGADRRAQLAHHRRRAHAAPDDVAEHQRGPARAEVDHVVPVAADLRPRHARPVVGGDVEPLGVEGALRQQAALQLVGDPALAVGRLALGLRPSASARSAARCSVTSWTLPRSRTGSPSSSTLDLAQRVVHAASRARA